MPVAYPKERHTKELIQEVRREYLNGASSWDLTVKYMGVASRNTIRSWIEDIVRPSGGPTKEVSESEVAQRAAKIREEWGPEIASRRWVGQWGQTAAESRGSCLSKALRAMGGRDG